MKLQTIAVALGLAVLACLLLIAPQHNAMASGTIQEARTTNRCVTSTFFEATCSVSVRWPLAFPDTNYTVVCTPENGQPPAPTSIDMFVYVLPSSKTTTGASMTIQNFESGVGATLNGIGCIAVHD
jgi:hypothetical protein